MTIRLLASVSLILATIATPAAAQIAAAQAASGDTRKAKPADPDEKICQTITMTGSRLAKKRFCATRAEWEDMRLQDRQATEKIQMGPCVVNGTSCK